MRQANPVAGGDGGVEAGTNAPGQPCPDALMPKSSCLTPAQHRSAALAGLLYSRATKQSERLGTGRMQPGHGRLSARPPRQATPRLCP